MESKRFVRSPHVVTARRADPATDYPRIGWWVMDNHLRTTCWVSDEDFQKEYVEVPEGEEPVVFSIPDKLHLLGDETLTEKATEGTYKGFLPLDAAFGISPLDGKRKPYSSIFRGWHEKIDKKMSGESD